MRYSILVFWLLAITCSSQVVAVEEKTDLPKGETKPLKILFIGNSYTGAGSLVTTMVKLLSEAANIRPIQPSMVAPGGYTFEDHWNIAAGALKKGVTNNVTINTLRQGEWDVVVLQGYVDAIRTPEQFRKYGKLLVAEALKKTPRVILYETWPYSKPTVADAAAMAKYNAAYFGLAKETGATVSPAGMAFEMVKTRKPEMGALIHRGGNDEHQSATGAYLIACVHFATIYDRSPVGLPRELFRNEGEKKRSQPFVAVDNDTAEFLQHVAWDAVQEAKKIATQTVTTVE